jgi:hypothetical protein
VPLLYITAVYSGFNLATNSLFLSACVQQVKAGLMTSGLMSIYIVFLCWSAIMRSVQYF